MKLKPLATGWIVRALRRRRPLPVASCSPTPRPRKPQKGEVVAVGDGPIEDGKRRPLDVSAGDEVLYSKYGGTEIKVDGEELLVLRESDVLAIVE